VEGHGATFVLRPTTTQAEVERIRQKINELIQALS
jgi:hypothetical protein